MDGGNEGSNNYAQILREDGSTERHHMCTTIPVKKDEVIRIFTANGGGVGDPKLRDHSKIESDIRNGYITEEQARRDYDY